jgi:type I restriction enzyme S subunit
MDRRTTLTSEARRQGLEFVGMEHVDPETGQIARGQGSRTGEGKGQAFLFDDRHVLFGKLRPYLRKIALPRQAGCASTELVPLLPDANRLDRSYLFHWVRRQPVIDALMAKNTGARMPRADMSVLLDMPILLPPLEEQLRIVRVLDRAAEIRRRADAARAKARAIIPALFLDMFGDPATNSKGWPVAELGTLLDRIDGGWSPVCGDGAPTPDQWGVLKLSAVKSLGFVGSEAKRLPETVTPREDLEVCEGDLLITRKNTIDLVGTAAVADGSGRKRMLPDTIFRLVPREPPRFFPNYASTLINLPSFRPAIKQLASGSASSMPGISKGRLSALKIPLADVALQAAFAEQVQRLGATARALDTAAAKAEAMATALSAQVFGALLPTDNC